MITIAYVTARKDPKIEWFFDSLRLYSKDAYNQVEIVVVDYYADELVRREHFQNLARRSLIHVTPKPTPWKGKYRLTSKDYFAAANTRNTAVCYASQPRIVFVDDLSVLLPSWWTELLELCKHRAVGLGAYRKVKKLVVDNGNVTRFESYPEGVDSRWNLGAGGITPAAGSWLFGCSVTAPIEAFLQVNGFEEAADAMTGEDYLTGMMLERLGWPFVYNRSMVTYESEEHHHIEPKTGTIWKPFPGFPDANHAIIDQVMKGNRKRSTLPYELRDMRNHILNGGSFPTTHAITHHWPDNQPFSEL